MTALALVPTSASAWAPADTAAVHPGVQTYTAGGQCTANFVFTDGASTYIGQAAHCSGTDGNTATDGCTSGTLPEGTPVEVDGSDGNAYNGTMVYNSWAEMQRLGETDADTCAFNDIALVKLDAAAVAQTNPSVPGWGGPTGLGSLGSNVGDDVYTYGNSSLRAGITTLSPKQGVVVTSNGWSTTLYTASPGIPGDSGSGFLNPSGQASGILSTLAAAPFPASNNVGDLPRELAWMHQHTGFTGVQVVNGTEPFQTDLLTAIENAR